MQIEEIERQLIILSDALGRIIGEIHALKNADYFYARRQEAQETAKENSYLTGNSVSVTEQEDEMFIEIDVPGISMSDKPRKDGRYQGHVKLDNGVVKYLYGRSKKELYKKIQNYINSGSPLPKQKPKPKKEKPVISFADWVNKWLELYKKPNVKYNTYNCLVQSMKKVLGQFGKFPVNEIKTEDLQIFFLSYTALRSRDVAIATTKMALEKAKQQNLISYNPMDGVEINPKKAVHKTALTVSEQETLLRAIKFSGYNAIINLLLTTGLRIGEALALTDSDIDFIGKTLSVNKTAVSIDGKKVIQDSPKTDAGRRTVPVPDYVLDLLKGKTGILFDFSYNSVRLYFQRLSHKIGIKITPHILRHTYATRLEEAGVSPKLKQYLLGHASLVMTQNTYTDIQKGYIDKVNHQISSIFLPSEK